MEQNPYAPSQVSPTPSTNTHDGVVITPTALAAVTGTQFWVKFIGIVFFIIATVQIFSVFNGLGRTNYSVAGTAIFIYLIPITSIVAYIILATRLMQYGSAIKALSTSRDPVNFEIAMEAQTKYWRLLGIITIAMMALMVLGIIALLTSQDFLFF